MRVVAWGTVLCLTACATLGGVLQEQRTDATLARYLRPVRYAGPIDQLARKVIEDLRQHERWHREHNLIHRFNIAAGAPTATISGSAKSLNAIRPVMSEIHGEQLVTLDERNIRHPASDAEPIRVEFTSVRESYVLSETSEGFMIAVRNRGDGDRLYHRELEFLQRVDPKRGNALKSQILVEHPDIEFEPWRE